MQKRAEHKARMEANHGLSGHPKADKLYEIAWEFGHSAGYGEIEIYYDQLVDLVK
jgi:hypothetical protein